MQLYETLGYSAILCVDFTRQYPEMVHPDNALGFLSDDDGESYNRCHCACYLSDPVEAHGPNTISLEQL